MGDIEKTHLNLTGAAADDSLPVTSRNTAIALIEEGNALKNRDGLPRQWRGTMLPSKRIRDAHGHT